jgi:thioredoxin 1
VPAVTELTPEQFKTQVEEAHGPVLVEFYADWCPDCQAAGPVYEALAAEMSGEAGFVRINVQEHPGIAQEYGVKHIPHFILFENGGRIREAVEIKNREDMLRLLNGES